MNRNIIAKQGIEIMAGLSEKAKKKFHNDLTSLMQDVGKKTEQEFAQSLINAMNEAAKEAGKSFSLKIDDVVSVEGLGKQIVNEIIKGASAGIKGVVSGDIGESLIKDTTKRLKQLEQRRDILLNKQNSIKKRRSNNERYEDILDLPNLVEYDEVEGFTSKDIKARGGDIQKIAVDMENSFLQAETALSRATKGTVAYYKALMRASETAHDLYRLSKYFEKHPTAKVDPYTKSNYEYDVLNDTTKDVLGEITKVRGSYGSKVRANTLTSMKEADTEELQKISNLLDKIQTQTTQLQGTEVVDLSNLQRGVRSAEQLEKAYGRLLTKQGKLSSRGSGKVVGEALAFDPDTSNEKLLSLYNSYQAIPDDDDHWERKYAALVRYVKIYDKYMERGDGLVTKPDNQYTQLYEQLKPMRVNAENMLQQIYDRAKGVPVVVEPKVENPINIPEEVTGGKDKVEVPVKASPSKSGISDEELESMFNDAFDDNDVNNANKIAEANRKAAEEAERKAKAEREAIEAAERARLAKEAEAEEAQKNANIDDSNTKTGTGDASSADLKAAQDEADRLRKEKESLQNDLELADVHRQNAQADLERERQESLDKDVKIRNLQDENTKLNGDLLKKDGVIENLNEQLAKIQTGNKPDAESQQGVAINEEQLKSVLNSITYKVRTEDNSNSVRDVLSKMSNSNLENEYVGMLNSLTGIISDEYIKGDADSARGQFKNKNDYDTMFHNHLGGDAASPSPTDLKTFAQEIENFKKQLIITRSQIASFDFSDYDSNTMKEILNSIAAKWESLVPDRTYIQDKEIYGKTEAEQRFRQRVMVKEFSQYPGVMQIHNIEGSLDKILSQLPLKQNVGAEVDANKVAIDEQSLRAVLESITYNTKSMAGDNEPTDATRAPWAREDTLSGQTNPKLDSINTVLESIKTQEDANKNLPASDVGNVLATENTLGEIKSLLEGINSKVISGNAKIIHDEPTPEESKALSNDVKDGKKVRSSGMSEHTEERIRTAFTSLTKLKTSLQEADQLSGNLEVGIEELYKELGKVSDSSDLAIWNEHFKQFKNGSAILQALSKDYARLGKIMAQFEAETDPLKKSQLEDDAQILKDSIDVKSVDVNVDDGRFDEVYQRAYNLERHSIQQKEELTTATNETTKAKQQEAQATKELVVLYKQLGQAEARRDMVAKNVAEEVMADDEVEAIKAEIEQKRKLVKINDELEGKFAKARTTGVEKETAKAVGDLGKQYERFGRLRAEYDTTPSGAYKDSLQKQLDTLEKIVALESKRLGVDDNQQESFDIEADKAYYAERAKLEERAAKDRDKTNKKELVDTLKRADFERKKLENERWSAQKKSARASYGIDYAQGAFNVGTKTVNDIIASQDIGGEVEAKVRQLQESVRELDEAKRIALAAINVGKDVDSDALLKQANHVNTLTQELQELWALHQKYSGDNSEIIPGDVSSFKDLGLKEYEQQLRAAAEASVNGKLSNIQFDQTTKELTGTVKTGANSFQTYSFAVDEIDGSLKRLSVGTKRTESFIEGASRKMRELAQYAVSSFTIYDAFNQIRKGVTYIKEIDDALTELKKVTNETDQVYKEFLDTASQTANKVGSTIKEVVSSTADFARLGYSMQEAATMAENAQLLMNVSEFDDISSATDTLISAMQANNCLCV